MPSRLATLFAGLAAALLALPTSFASAEDTKWDRVIAAVEQARAGQTIDDRVERQATIEEWPYELFSTHLTADDFGSAVALAARSTLETFGEDGYLEKWIEHPFPTRALVALEAALAVPEGSGRIVR